MNPKPFLIKKARDGSAWVGMHRHHSHPLGFIYCSFDTWLEALDWCDFMAREVDLDTFKK